MHIYYYGLFERQANKSLVR